MNKFTLGKKETAQDAKIEYYVDQQGEYYYHQLTAVKPNAVDMPIAETDSKYCDLKFDGGGNQIVTMHSANTEDMCYVIVREEQDSPFINVAFNIDKKKKEDIHMKNYEHDCAIEVKKEQKCKEAEDTESNMNKQKSSKDVKPRLQCPSCSYSCAKRYLLLRHMKIHLKNRPYMCHICERRFKTVASLENHVNSHTGHKPFVCKYCSKAFTTSGELIRHTRYMHTLEKPHKCPECEYASVERSKLRRHMRCHTGERPYQCCHCTYAAADNFKLKRHLRIHTGEKPYKCDICNMRFNQANSLKSHQYTHNVAYRPVFACEFCPVTCGRKVDLRAHIQNLHSKDKVHKCGRCGMSFSDKYSHKVHTKTHKDDKFKCETCPFMSKSRRYLKEHTRIHSGEKPFVCDLCQQRFRQKQLLRRHINVYHDPAYKRPQPREKIHTCYHCNKKYASKGNLNRHMVTHDPEKERKILSEKKRTNKDDQNKEVLDQKLIKCEESKEDNMIRDEIVTVADGDHYVVLQIIVSEDDDAGDDCR